MKKDEDICIDKWQPAMNQASLPKSEWRQRQIDGNYNQQPGMNDIRKIMMHLKKKHPDHEIMEVFGITSETLVAIKAGRYSPIDGISLDNQSKIYNEFSRLEKRIKRLTDGLKFIADNVLDASEIEKITAFQLLIGMKPKKVASDEEE